MRFSKRGKLGNVQPIFKNWVNSPIFNLTAMKSTQNRIKFVFILLIISNITSFSQSDSSSFPYPQAHAHNDYAHKHPLFDALKHGFTSVEADIFLIKGKLVVAHTYPVFGRKRTLTKLYLEPLAKRIEKNEGAVYPGMSDPFTLMIDFKTGGSEIFATLLKELQPYRQLLQRRIDGKLIAGPIRIVLSGNRPDSEEMDGKNQWVWLDGRPSDFVHDLHQDKIAWISDRYGKHFSWKGKGPMPEAEKTKLAEFVRQSHARGAEVRFWATPENETVWQVLLKAGVDRISTDDLIGFHEFLQNRTK